MNQLKNKDMDKNLDLSFLEKLISVPSPSGYEQECQEVFKSYMTELGGNLYYSDHIGNVAYSFGDTEKPKILLSAHIDELGFIVLKVEDSGLLVVESLGGIDRKSIIASEVMVQKFDRSEWIRGIIGKKPIHAETSEERNGEIQKIHELRIDIGCTSKEEVLNSCISIGSLIVFPRPKDIMFGEKLICAPGLDDKAGIYVLGEIVRRLDIEKLGNYCIIVASCVQEELGLRGATVLAQNIKPEISIDFDVTPSNDFGVSPEEFGEVKLGSGPVINLGPTNNREIWSLFLEGDTSHQPVVSWPGGTNTDVIQRFGGNCKTQLVSIPIKNLHTQTECCNLSDIETTIEKTLEVIYSGKL